MMGAWPELRTQEGQGPTRIISPPAPGREQLAPAPKRLTRAASLNALTWVLDYLVKMLVSLLIVPILVSGLGGTLFGVWQILWRLVNYLTVADGKPTDALRLVISTLQGEDHLERKRRSVGSALFVWLLFTPLLAAVGIGLAALAPVFTKVGADLYPVVRLTCFLLVLNILLMNLTGLPDAVLRGENLGYKGLGLIAGLNILCALLMVGSILLGFGLVGLAVAQVVVSALTGVVWWVLVKKYVPWFGLDRPTRTELREFFRLNLWNWAGALTAILYWSTDVLILGLLASPATVTVYVLNSYPATTTISVASVALSAAAPGLGQLFGQGAFQRLGAIRRELFALSWLMATTIGSTILLCNHSFLSLWVGKDYYAGMIPNLLLVVLMAQAIFIYCDIYYLESSLRLRDKVVVGATCALLSIVFAWALTPKFGIPGLCLGLLAGRSAQMVVFPLLVRSS
ncbi:MAG: hypothetical protein JO112_09855, partial [Planctomycetes bacterium]|nr:hypothetical protein [Planctomycetota bacterium]